MVRGQQTNVEVQFLVLKVDSMLQIIPNLIKKVWNDLVLIWPE